MRLFIAVELTGDARAAIAAEQRRMAAALRQAGDEGIRLVRPEHMHLTLSFLGEVTEERVSGIVAAVEPPFALRPFRLSFGGVGIFPPRGAPRVLWLGVGQGERDAVELQRQVASRMESVGIPPESRPFHPHLTLGRWRDRSSRAGLARTRWDDRTVATIDVAAVTLFRSTLSSAAPVYTALAEGRLAGPEAGS
jgi:2'-5' RNA ligase